MTYAKLDNGVLHLAPKKINDGTKTTYNPPAEMLIELGYKELIYTDAPETDETHYAVPSWEESENAITQVWSTVEIPDEVTGDEVISALEEIL